MKFFKEFKAFISRGNIIDLAIGVVIGGAFSAIVTSLVNDIIMPLINLATGNGVQGLALVLNGVPKYIEDAATGAQVLNPEAVLWNYGNFIQSIINFLIIAMCLFLGLKVVMSVKAAGERSRQRHIASIEDDLKSGDITPEEARARKAALGVEEPEPAPEPVPAPETQEDILRDIRELLKEQKNGEKKD